MTATAKAKRESSFKYGAATVVLLGVISTATQFAAAVVYDVVEYFEWGTLSTGGAVAFIAAVAMWVGCRSWEQWAKWVWLPIGVIVVLAFLFMSIHAQQVAEAELARQSEIAAACDALWEQGQAKAAELADLQAAWAAQNDPTRPSWRSSFKDAPSWESSGPSLQEKAAQAELDQLAIQYNSNC